MQYYTLVSTVCTYDTSAAQCCAGAGIYDHTQQLCVASKLTPTPLHTHTCTHLCDHLDRDLHRPVHLDVAAGEMPVLLRPAIGADPPAVGVLGLYGHAVALLEAELARGGGGVVMLRLATPTVNDVVVGASWRPPVGGHSIAAGSWRLVRPAAEHSGGTNEGGRGWTGW